MSLMPSFQAILQEGLNDNERNEVLNKLKSLKGVLAANFNRSGSAVNVSYDNSPATKKAAKKVDGVKAIGNLF